MVLSRVNGPSMIVSKHVESVAVEQPIESTIFNAPYQDLLLGGSFE